MKKVLFTIILLGLSFPCFCWGFFGHRVINEYAVFLLPPEMLVLYKPNINFITEHAVDPDKRRYAVAGEGPRHYIDIDLYGTYPYPELPRKYEDAVMKYGEATVQENGIVPWAVMTMYHRLVNAFKEKNFSKILKTSTELGHYIADAHVPLHASSNHNGQLSDQKGIHAFWESRVPELLAAKEFDFFIGKAEYIKNPDKFIWDRVLESALAADSVLRFEKILNDEFKSSKYSYEERNGSFIRQYSTAYTIKYNQMLDGMVERRMRESIYAIASFWYTAWVNAGQPDLKSLVNKTFDAEDLKEFESLNEAWQKGKVIGRAHDEN
ncbi:MAG: S1/P1 Nuclease [Chitinophagaceae bacterium]|nr:S1/P1 Nuclease [Chitinophagaceae bacterium]MCW5913294.1 S1/P1 Nuclease [Chitinophagaceae bacterium]MCZ2397084.1 zinc dependent phospholipase C family protein [Chitinophagales bacterium]